jgi:hypothetical protein
VLRRELLICACASALASALLAGGVSGASGTTEASSVGGCNVPVVHDTYDGFHVGVPAGWHLSSGSGLILVQKTFSGATEGVIESAYLSGGQTPAKYFAATLSGLNKKAKGNHNLLDFKLTSPTTATITGRSGKVAFAGAARARLIRTHAAHGTRVGVFSAYWAPPSTLAAQRKQLASIGACFGLEQGTLSILHQTNTFTYSLPIGWKVSSQGAENLFLNDGKKGSANYLLEGPFPTTSGIKDAQTLFQASINDLGIKVDQVLLSELTPQVRVATGVVEQQLVVQFRGTLGTEQVEALARVISESQGGTLTGELRIAVARQELWNSLNGMLIWTTDGIQHDYSQDETSLIQVQQQLAGFAQQVVGFRQALDGTDVVEDPATGAKYEAPYDAFVPSGPDGPGYYAGAPGKLKKLRLVGP